MLTIKLIKKHKKLFLILLLLQTICLVSGVAIGTFYQVKIMENARGIIEPLQNANYDSESIEQGKSFTKEISSIYANYQSMTKNILALLGWLLLLFIILNGRVWLLTQNLFQKRKLTEELQMLGRFVVSLIVIMGVFFGISYGLLIYLLRLEVSLGVFSIAVISLLSIYMLFYYLLITACALIHYPWKEFMHKFFVCAIKKIHKSVLVLLINNFLIFLSLLVIFASINYEKSLWFLLLAGILLVVVMVITRIFWVACLQELATQK